MAILELTQKEGADIHTLSFGEVNGGLSYMWVSFYDDHYRTTNYWDITKEQAQQIIDHLKTQFQL